MRMRIRPVQFVLLGLLLSFPQTIFAQWETLGNVPYTDGPNAPFFVYFLAPVGLPEVGYCSFQNTTDTLYKTTDFGKTWTANFACPYSYPNWVRDIVFKDSLHGWICTWDPISSRDTSTMEGRIYSTSDGGNSWQEASRLGGCYWKLRYNPLSHCLIADGSQAGGFVISHDDGATFTGRDINLWEYLGILFIGDSTIILSTSGDPHHDVRSTDEGLTWTTINLPTFMNSEPYYSNESCLAFSLGIGGQNLFVSSDKGLTWNPRHTFAETTNGQIVGACGYIATAYLAGNQDSETVMLSSDYGLTWQDIGKHSGAHGTAFSLMKMDATGLYLINNGVIQRYSLPKLLLIYTGSPTTYVTPNGFETDIPLYSKANCFDIVVSLSGSSDATCNVLPSAGWDIKTKQLGPGLYELIGMSSGADSLTGTLQILQNITDTGEQTVTIQPDPLDAISLASCEESKTTYQLPGCGAQTLYDFMRTGKLPDFSIYPNPAENFITIESPVKVNANLDIFDQLGRRVADPQSLVFKDNKNILIDVSKIASGIYFLRIESGVNVQSRRIIINR